MDKNDTNLVSAPISPAATPRARSGRVVVAGLVTGGLILVAILGWRFLPFGSPPPALPTLTSFESPPRELAVGGKLSVWWEHPRSDVEARSVVTGTESNIHPADYVGPDACKGCHSTNYNAWAEHPHRWMNALAEKSTVLGDFSGKASIAYRGGTATFAHADGKYLMRLEREGTSRVYTITQTIGRRFFQYYVGKQIEGPEPAGHRFYSEEHVLPFGYWLDEKQWVPVVHIGSEHRDEERIDPYNPPSEGAYYAEYSASCNYCHTTFPLGDLLARRTQQMGQHAPVKLHWSVKKYLETAHSAEFKEIGEAPPADGATNPMAKWDAPHYAATLGISCEACHLGSRKHVESLGRVLPSFFPQSPFLLAEAPERSLNVGRTHDNVNWSCGRCHIGNRPAFAGGMSTWNSVEYSDAMRGSCYSRARCVDCHNPHQTIGKHWTALPDKDDAACLKCHKKFEPAQDRIAHTHHPAGSEGARCLNCHMPRINEGLQDVVRTHMIFSPTRKDMIEANHPNACNLCHTDRPIDWTLSRLKDWYGKTYDDRKIAANYPHRSDPVGLGWLKSDNESVRLVGADALARSRKPEVVPNLLDALDDPYLLNRQFAMRSLQERLDVRISESSYRFYMTADERKKPLADLRARYAPQ
jgi:predicted CXXCH cytochrome family protein